jgi:uncharacterized protein YjbJ (UPF0337 family)
MTKLSTQDKVTGKIHEVAGGVKQQIGKLTENSDLEAKGQAEKITGKAQQGLGAVEKVFGN